MIGNLSPCIYSLPKTARNEYRNIYCSLCSYLKKESGLLSTFVINNEITLLILSIRNYFSPEKIKTACPVTFYLLSKPAYCHNIFQEASRWAIILAWFKIIDKETDEPGLKVKLAKKIFENKIKNITRKMNKEEKKEFDSYLNLIKTNNSFHDNCELTADLSRYIFNKISGCTAINCSKKEQLSRIFYNTGYLITIADALVDVQLDFRKNNYNPILNRSNNIEDIRHNFEKYYKEFRDISIKLKEEIKELSEKSLTNLVFQAAMESSLDRLNSKIMNMQHLILFSENEKDLKVNNQANYTFPAKRLVTVKSVVCCDDILNNCCQFCCQDCWQNCCNENCSNCCSGCK